MTDTIKPLIEEDKLRGTPETSAIQQVPAPQSGVWVLIATILGSSMAFIDGTVVNVALPVLQLDLKATVADVQWVVEAYSLFLAALILVGGSLGDHFGRRRIFAIGVSLFAVASTLCGLAPTIVLLIIARAIQGIGMAVTVAPLTTAVMGAVNTQHADGVSGVNNAVSRAMGLLAIAVQGLVVLAVFSSSLDSHLARLSLPSVARTVLIAQQSKLVGIALPTGLNHAAQAAIQQAIAESFVTGFRVVMLITAGLALASALSALLLIEDTSRTSDTTPS